MDYHERGGTRPLSAPVLPDPWQPSGGLPDFALARFLSSGALDTTLGNGGTVSTPVGAGEDIAYSMAIQTTGGSEKAVLAGYSHTGANLDLALTRYNTN